MQPNGDAHKISILTTQQFYFKSFVVARRLFLDLSRWKIANSGKRAIGFSFSGSRLGVLHLRFSRNGVSTSTNGGSA